MKEIKFNIYSNILNLMIIEFRIKSLRNIRLVIFFMIKVKMIKFIRVFRINVCICEKI